MQILWRLTDGYIWRKFVSLKIEGFGISLIAPAGCTMALRYHHGFRFEYSNSTELGHIMEEMKHQQYDCIHLSISLQCVRNSP
jgi:hypothetical protein